VTGVIDGNTGHQSNNASILSCFIKGSVNGSGSSNSLGWNICNNIIYNNSGSNSSTHQETIRNFYEALIDHNSIRYYNTTYSNYSYCIYDVYNSTITNNVIEQKYNNTYCIHRSNLSNNNIISHNILSCSSITDYPNNKFNCTSSSSIYSTDWSTSYSERDIYYVLSESSIAKGYAEDGSDCGPWSGAYPYVLCGYPLYVPRFESINVASEPDESGNLKIQMVIKNQNK
jgi:hypothetical protein